jgi:D-3-phosphoglycerate dehydrogenase
MKILVCDDLPEKGLSAIQAIRGSEVESVGSQTERQLAKIIAGFDAVVVRSATRVTREVIEGTRNLQVIARAGMGCDNIDVEAATKKGVVVMNTPAANAVSVAEHTIAMMLALARHIPDAHHALREGRWEKKSFPGTELGFKVLGIVGLGNVGRMVAGLARAFKMEVLATDPNVPATVARDLGVSLVSLRDLLKKSDYVSLHASLHETTAHMINEKTIAQMKEGVRIINAARGGLVDEKALAKALKSGIVAAAALDVFEEEPLPTNHPFLQLKNVILTPHLGASTVEAQQRVAVAVAEQLRAYFVDHVIVNAVNVPV